MAQSLSKIYVHLVFHKKYSSVAILEKDLPKLFAYIDGIIVNNKEDKRGNLAYLLVLKEIIR